LIKRTIIAVLSILAWLGLAAPASADMVLNKVVVDFDGKGAPRDDVKIINTGNETLFVLVEPHEVINPGTKEEKRVKIRDPGKSGLLVTPNRFVLQAKQSKSMRLVVLKPADNKDRVYRLTVKPIVGKVQASQTGVKIVIGYDVLVLVRPQGSKPEISAKREGKKLTFTNTGTTSALLTNGKQCDTAGENCIDAAPKRLYAGITWSTDLKYDTPVEYYVTVGQAITRQSF